MHDVAVVVGSARKGSITRKVSRAMAEVAPQSLRLSEVEITALQMYDQDLDALPPASWVMFRQRIGRAAAVLFVTPEYNRSIPALLKNAIDVGSRPYGSSVWAGKPAAVVSCSPSAMGGFGANHHLRQSLVYLDMPTMAQPEAYIGHADKLFDANDAIAKASTRDFLVSVMTAFERWIDIHVNH